MASFVECDHCPKFFIIEIFVAHFVPFHNSTLWIAQVKRCRAPWLAPNRDCKPMPHRSAAHWCKPTIFSPDLQPKLL
jgi:hypothetical protein